MTYIVLRGSAPQYIEPLVCVADLPGRRTFRSADTNRLVVPLVRLRSVTDRAQTDRETGPSRSQGFKCGTNYPKTVSLHHRWRFLGVI